MSKHEKTLKKIYEVPTPSDIRWDDVASCLSSMGFKEVLNKGSKRKFYNPTSGQLGNIHKPHPQPTLKIYQVKDIKDLINKQRDWEKNQ
jgi:predicted RNA binding protein YcfA (HicA-like mRNA interferase family)